MNTRYQIPDTRYLTALFAVLLAALLIGQRFGFVWAGGTGYAPERSAGVVKMVGVATIDRNGATRDAELWKPVARGETIRTSETVRVKLQLNFAHTVAIDQNTDLTIEENTPNGIVLLLTRGRIYVDTHDGTDWAKTVTVKTNYTYSTISTGALSVVNYDFLQKVSVAPIETEVAVSESDTFYVTGFPIDIYEATQQMDITVPPFDPNSGAAAEFYGWAIE